MVSLIVIAETKDMFLNTDRTDLQVLHDLVNYVIDLPPSVK